MSSRRRIRVPVRKTRRPRVRDVLEAPPTPIDLPSRLRMVLRDIDHMLDGMDEVLGERGAV